MAKACPGEIAPRTPGVELGGATMQKVPAGAKYFEMIWEGGKTSRAITDLDLLSSLTGY
jgi:hypothetical protein